MHHYLHCYAALLLFERIEREYVLLNDQRWCSLFTYHHDYHEAASVEYSMNPICFTCCCCIQLLLLAEQSLNQSCASKSLYNEGAAS